MGTNPIAVAAPAAEGDSFVLDMATTAVAVGKVNKFKCPVHDECFFKLKTAKL